LGSGIGLHSDPGATVFDDFFDNLIGGSSIAL
jgi:hypothetical protein